MEVKIVDEWGYAEALFGIGLSFGLTSKFNTVGDFVTEGFYRSETVRDRLSSVALKLAHRGGGESKFLESMCVAIDVNAPRYWWSEFDTYRVGTTKQSESTMHTITKRHLTQGDFELEIPESYLVYLNNLIDSKGWYTVKQMLPEGFLQRRMVVTNYKTLQNMYYQRKNHRLPEWKKFCSELRNGLEHFEFIENYENED